MTSVANSNPTDIDPAQPGCLVCKGPLIRLADNLPAASSRADALYPVSVFECSRCGHVQKGVGAGYVAQLQDVYKVSYALPGGGRKNNIVDGKLISRERTLAKALGAPIAGSRTGSVLDVGTGTGFLLAAFAEELPHFDIVGYDLNDEKEGIVRGNGATDFYSGSLATIPKTFDLITLNHVLEHIPDPVAVLKQASALLKPDGRLAVIVPSYRTVHTDFFFLEHCSHFTEKSLNVVAALAGLSIVDRLEGVVGLTEIGFVARLSEPRKSVTPDQAIAWSRSLPDFIRSLGDEKVIGIFGVNGAGMWLGAVLKDRISFYVDDDPAKQGTEFAEFPIISVSNIPVGSLVVVPFNNPDASASMRRRLQESRPDVEFIAPPIR